MTYEIGGVNIRTTVDELLQYVDVTKPRSPQQRRHSNLRTQQSNHVINLRDDGQQTDWLTNE